MPSVWDTLWANLQPLIDVAFKVMTGLPAATSPMWLIILMPFAAVLAMALRTPRRLRRFRYRRIFAALVAVRYFQHKSHRLDLIMAAGNVGVFAMVGGLAIISVSTVHAAIYGAMTTMFGIPTASTLNATSIGLTWSVAMYVAYEFAYWLDHYLSHKIPFLWEFHKVHHSAEVLSPITNLRVHPVDSIVYINIMVLCTGLTAALLTYGFGMDRIGLEMWGIMSVVGMVVGLASQLQHSHVWLPLRGWLGRLILSPAHHQIHHSVAREHHDKNFGNMFGVFDWLFGTLYVPPKQRPKLVFGVDTLPNPEHDLKEAIVTPFIEAARRLAPKPAARD
jgi:sterol desaturase/sphingolipid hydroxylase (fatty acid hydroxylase superfamily)